MSDQATLDRAVANIDPDVIYVDNAELIRRAAISPASGAQAQSGRQPQTLIQQEYLIVGLAGS